MKPTIRLGLLLALVVGLGCALFTNWRGFYSYRKLPEGDYTIQALAGRGNVSKLACLGPGARVRANFSLDPRQDDVEVIVIEAHAW